MHYSCRAYSCSSAACSHVCAPLCVASISPSVGPASADRQRRPARVTALLGADIPLKSYLRQRKCNMFSNWSALCIPQVVFDLEWVSGGTAAAAAIQPGNGAEVPEDEVMLPAAAPMRAHPVNAGIAARAVAGEDIIVVPTDTLYGASNWYHIICISRKKKVMTFS